MFVYDNLMTKDDLATVVAKIQQSALGRNFCTLRGLTRFVIARFKTHYLFEQVVWSCWITDESSLLKRVESAACTAISPLKIKKITVALNTILIITLSLKFFCLKFLTTISICISSVSNLFIRNANE